MPKQPQAQVDEELKQQDDETYGTSYTDSSDDEKFADTEEMVKDVTGNVPDPEKDGFSIAEEEEKDADDILHGEPDDLESSDE